MRHFVGAALLLFGLVVTFGAASVLQGMAVANRRHLIGRQSSSGFRSGSSQAHLDHELPARS